nr:28 kDa ribonucleoprotein, chloroplastic-like [Tanacetum cinerariifolium]
FPYNYDSENVPQLFNSSRNVQIAETSRLICRSRTVHYQRKILMPVNVDWKMYQRQEIKLIISENVPQLFNSSRNVQIAEMIYNTDNEQSRGLRFATMSADEEDKKVVEAYKGYSKKPLGHWSERDEGLWRLEGNVKATEALEWKNKTSKRAKLWLTFELGKKLNKNTSENVPQLFNSSGNVQIAELLVSAFLDLHYYWFDRTMHQRHEDILNLVFCHVEVHMVFCCDEYASGNGCGYNKLLPLPLPINIMVP